MLSSERVSFFWSRVNKCGPINHLRPELGPCWLWTGSKATAGYGTMLVDGRAKRAHVLSWMLAHGSMPERQINHRCLTRSCVNPEHLEDVSVLENLHDSPFTAASINARKTKCPVGHEYSPENTWIDKKRNIRHCRACHRKRNRDAARAKYGFKTARVG